MQLITVVTLLKVDTTLLSFLIRSVDIEADDHDNGEGKSREGGSQQAVTYCFIEWLFCQNACKRILRIPVSPHTPQFTKLSAVESYF